MHHRTFYTFTYDIKIKHICVFKLLLNRYHFWFFKNNEEKTHKSEFIVKKPLVTTFWDFVATVVAAKGLVLL